MPFASYVMQATCFFTIGFFVFGPQDVDRYGGGQSVPTKRRGRAAVCRFVCLSWCVACCWLLAKVLDTALERIFCGYRHRRWISALLLLPFERPDTARSVNAQTPREADVSHLFISYPAKLRNFPFFARRYLRPDLLLILQCMPHAVFISGVTHAGFFKPVRKPTSTFRSKCGKMRFKPFMQSYSWVFIGYLYDVPDSQEL